MAIVLVLVLVETAVFFFSSRRRHTIFKCDWSSDGVLFRSLLLASRDADAGIHPLDQGLFRRTDTGRGGVLRSARNARSRLHLNRSRHDILCQITLKQAGDRKSVV